MNNPPAFPQFVLSNGGAYVEGGMTLRDYFAAKAMQALIDNDGLFSEIPTQAYALADAMMKAREE
jgi:NADH:ubiquinone oxidoreductase subunit B-like Fe-S oxidoreductase